MISPTFGNRKFFLLTAALAVMSAPVFGAAIYIPVTNGSFEKPDVLNLTNGYPSDQNAAGGTQSAWVYTQQTATSTNKPHYYGPNNVNDAIPYWTVTSMNNPGLVYGVGNPVSTMYYGTNGGTGGGYTLTANTDYTFNTLASINSSHGYAYADGYQNAYANLASGGSVMLIYNPSDPNTGDPAGTGQSLGNFIPGDSYALTVGIGTSLTSYAYTYSITLLESLDGGTTWTPVGTASNGNSPANFSGDWTQTSYSFTAGGLDTGLIGIELTAANPNGVGDTTQANFDNVQLNDLGSSDSPPAPEPASLGLLSIGVLALRRRRRI
jgi:MYXO-CTERM domain-containing protein